MKTNTAQNMFAACACAFALSSLPAFTQNNRTWDSGRASGDWDYSSPNWSGSVFSPGDSAILGPLASGPATLNVVGEIEANSVIVVSGYYKLAGGTLDVRNGLTVSSGTLDILNLSKLNIDGSIALNGGKMRLSGGSGNIGFGLGQLTFGGGQLVFGNSGLSDIVFDGENTDIHRISATDINMALEQGVQLIVKNSHVNSTTSTPWGRGGVFYADATAGLGMGEAYSDSKVVIKGAVGSKMLFQSNSSFQNGGVIYSNTANGFKSLVNLSVGNTGSISFLDNYTR